MSANVVFCDTQLLDPQPAPHTMDANMRFEEQTCWLRTDHSLQTDVDYYSLSRSEVGHFFSMKCESRCLIDARSDAITFDAGEALITLRLWSWFKPGTDDEPAALRFESSELLEQGDGIRFHLQSDEAILSIESMPHPASDSFIDSRAYVLSTETNFARPAH